MLPQLYATSLIKCSATFDNAAPRSQAFQDKLKEKCSPADFARIERAKAAHANSLESFPLITVALVTGTFAGLPATSLNLAGAILLALRAIHSLLYINTQILSLSYARTLVWISSRIVALNILFKVAFKVADEGL